MKPVPVATSTRHGSAVRDRSVSLTRRLLGGSGRASMVACHLAPDIEVTALCHGLSRDGELMVACVKDDEVPVTAWGATSPCPCVSP